MAVIQDVKERFWRHVNKVEGDGCWEWTGTLHHHGYGQMQILDPTKSPGNSRRMGRKKMIASRVSWELHYGEIPSGLCICHTCDNPKCVRPDHLFLGTPKDNFEDARKKGRLGIYAAHAGESNGSAKLTIEKVTAIREEYAKGGVTKVELARKYGVTDVLIGLVIRNKIWKRE